MRSLLGKFKLPTRKGGPPAQASPATPSEAPSNALIDSTVSNNTAEATTVSTEATTQLHPNADAPTESTLPSLQTRLWNAAYDAIKEADPKLIDTYERILSSKLKEIDLDANEEDASGNDIAQDGDMRWLQMQALAKYGLKQTQKAESVVDKTAQVLQVINSVKASVSSALQSVPQAAVAWTGVCLALEILTNPITQSQSNRSGLKYVLLRMDWYWNLALLLLKENVVEEASQNMRAKMEETVARLYTKLLEYQIKSVCVHNRNWLVTVGLNTMKLDDWEGKLKSIQDEEAKVNEFARQYNSELVKSALHAMLQTTLSMELKLGEIQDAIQENTQQNAARHREAKDTECLTQLCVTDPDADKVRIEEKKGGLLKESYSWIIRHESFQRFLTDPETQLLWIKGDPGKGKTMLMCGIIDELKSTSRQLSYFFCEQANPKMNSEIAILRGLIFALAKQQPALLSFVRTKYDEQGQKLFAENAWVNFKDIFSNMIQSPKMNNAVILVDGLDECAHGRVRFLNFVLQCNKLEACSIKWIISSRNNWADIEERMRRMEQKLQLQLELNQDLVSDAIASYIAHKVTILSEDKAYPDEMRNSVEGYLRQHANGTFLWVALVCHALQHEHRIRRVMDTLRTFPSGLDALYKRMMHDVNHSKDASIYREILALACLVHQPLTLHELVALLPSIQDFEENEVIEGIGECGSFLALENGLVRFIHQSAKDFLLGEVCEQIFPSGIAQHHRLIVRRSIDELYKVLRRDMYNLERPGYFAEDITPPTPDPLASIRYPCLHWVTHLKECSTVAQQELAENGIIDRFLRHKFLYWLECFGLMQSMNLGARAVVDLGDIISKEASPDLSLLIKDANRFLQSSQSAIAEAPLQAYVSALMFSPKRSLIRQIYGNQQFTDMKLHNPPELDWSPCTRTLEVHGSSRNLLKFIHNDQRVVTCLSNDTVEIWDVATGECWSRMRREVEDKSDGSSFATFTDGALALFGLSTGVIEVWDVVESTLVRKLIGHGSRIKGLVLSGDEPTVTSVESNGVVRTWNLSNGAATVTRLESWKEDIAAGHEIKILHCTLSPNGRLLITQTFEANNKAETETAALGVRIYSTFDGKKIKTITGIGAEYMREIAVSNHGTKMALVSGSDAIQIWDLVAFQLLKSIDTGDQSVSRMIFSKDDDTIISLDVDGEVNFWNIETGVRLLSFQCRGAADPIALSSDKTSLVSYSHHSTAILVWDLEWDWDSPTSMDCSLSDPWLVLSPDWTLIATSLRDGSIEIWNTAAGERLCVWQNMADIACTAFSADSSLLLCSSTRFRIRVFNIAQSRCVLDLDPDLTVEYDARDLKGIFSPDSQKVITSFPNGDIKVYDIRSGDLLKTLSGDGYTVRNLVASPDGATFASVSSIGQIRIWDMRLIMSTPISQFGAPSLGSVITYRSIKHIMFSANGQYLATSKYYSAPESYETIAVWECATGIRKYVGDRYSDVLLTPAMVTNDGRPVMKTEGGDSPRYLSCSQDCKWIVRDGLPVIRLPPNYRMDRDNIAATDTSVAIGCNSGHVLFFEFDRS